MHSAARNQKLSHATSHLLNKLFLSGILAEADRMPLNFKFKTEVFPLVLCLTHCGRRAPRIFSKYPRRVSGMPEAQAGEAMYPQEGRRGRMAEEMEKEFVTEIK